MKLKKIGVILIILSVIFTLLIVNCKQKEEAISFWHLDTQDEQKAIWQQFADEFMEKNPNVTIEITVLENEAFKQKIATVMQSGNPPDLFRSWGGGVMNEYASAGLLKDISKHLKGKEWGKSFGQGPLSVYSYKGKYYGVPYDMGAVGIWYNKEIFDELGLKPFNTWTELLEGVNKIKESEYIPIALGEGDKWPGHFWWVYLAVRMGGKDAFDKAYSREGSFTDEPFIQAGEKLKELIDLEPFQNGFLGAGYNDEASLVGNGKAAMELMGQWAPYVQEANTDDKKGLGDKLGWFPFPMVEGGKGNPGDIMGGGNGFILGKNASPAAIEFLKYITSIENEKRIIDVIGVIPTVKGSESDIKDDNKLKIVDMVSNADYYQLYYDQYLPPAVGEVVKDATQGLFAETLTPKEAAETIDKSFENELK